MKLRLINREQELGDVWTFSFAVPEDVAWQAGQSIRLELATGLYTEEKRFTISSAVFEDRLDITTRLSGSKFKQALAALEINQDIIGFAVEGKFVVDNSKPKLWLASGIGVTPFYAILKQLQHLGRDPKIELIYAGHGEKLVFEDELVELASKASNLQVKFLHNRRLAKQDITVKNRQVYISGPEAMVGDLANYLLQTGLNPENLKTDSFTGQLD